MGYYPAGEPRHAPVAATLPSTKASDDVMQFLASLLTILLCVEFAIAAYRTGNHPG